MRSDEDSSTEIGADGRLTIDDAELRGYLDIDLRIQLDSTAIGATFDSDFDVTLADGCAVGGSLELHAVASASGSSQSVWVLAEYGPTRGDVAIR